jgi:hypothetical protein
VVPAVAGLLAERGVGLYGVTPRPPTLEDVYFAIEAGLGEEGP